MEHKTNELDQNIFVYGTLRSTEGNHGMLKSLNHEFLSDAQIHGEVFHTSFGYPCLMEGLGLVDGEMYAVDLKGLGALDRFEGHPDLYTRRQVLTTTGLPVWVYFGNEVQAGIISRR